MSASAAERPRSWRARWLPWWLLAALVLVFPLLRLLPLNSHFQLDWYNHTWLAAYSGEYLRQHGTLPSVVNTTEQAGISYPVFYGTLFYPLLSLLTVWLNPGIAIRVIVLVVTWLQLQLIPPALGRIGVPVWISRGVACLVIWAIYPLTNLYNRSAITEYFATGLLTCMVATWFLLVHAERPSDRTRYGLALGLLFTLAAGTHPITALYSLLLLPLLLVAAFVEHGRRAAFWWGLSKALALPVGLTAVVLAPWLYALAAFNKYLLINAEGGIPWFYKDSLDRSLVRFFPIPFDIRALHMRLERMSSPYLDAQINLPLLVLLLGWLAIFAARNRGAALLGIRSVLLALLAFAFFTWLSLSPSAFDHLPSMARMVQIAYRLITYENLSLLLGVFLLAGFLRRRGDHSLFEGRRLAAGLLVGCMVLSGVGVVIKWWHATRIMHVEGPVALRTKASERRRWVALPSSFYGYTAYVTPGLYTAETEAERAAAREVRIPIGVGDDFGVPQPVSLDLPNDTWIGTNIQAFPWNVVEIDGIAVPADQLRAESWRFVLRVPAGNHVLTFRNAPATTWLVLRAISFGGLALWLTYVLYWSLRRRNAIARFPSDGPGLPLSPAAPA